MTNKIKSVKDLEFIEKDKRVALMRKLGYDYLNIYPNMNSRGIIKCSYKKYISEDQVTSLSDYCCRHNIRYRIHYKTNKFSRKPLIELMTYFDYKKADVKG